MFPLSFGSDRRKPVSPAFASFAEQVYCPLVYSLLFGTSAWREKIERHLSSFKSNTIKIKTVGWVPNSFHMHVDGRIGILQPKNHTQKRSSRYLFSIVPAAIQQSPENSATVLPQPADPDVRDPHGTTVYPIWQPLKGFNNTESFHKYMTSAYPERGLSLNFPRPLYEIPERLVYRSKTGEVLVHDSHVSGEEVGCQVIHAEANPCPDRYLYVFDFYNVCYEGQKGRKSEDIPQELILEQMRALSSLRLPCKERLDDVKAVVERLREGDEVTKYPHFAATETFARLLEAIETCASLCG